MYSPPVIPTAANFGLNALQYPNAKFIPISLIGTVSGDNDLYTVPAGRKLIVWEFIATNPTGGAIAFQLKAKISGVYNLIVGNGSVGAGASTPVSSLTPFLWTAGDVVSMNTSALGASVWMLATEFSDTSPWQRSTFSAFASGDNVVFTAPTGVTFETLYTPFASAIPSSAAFSNLTGGSRTIVVFAVPNGGSSSTANRIMASTVVSNALTATGIRFANMAPGDSLVINSDANTAGQFAWVVYCTYPQ